jgi:hypothetical protein
LRTSVNPTDARQWGQSLAAWGCGGGMKNGVVAANRRNI